MLRWLILLFVGLHSVVNAQELPVSFSYGVPFRTAGGALPDLYRQSSWYSSLEAKYQSPHLFYIGLDVDTWQIKEEGNPRDHYSQTFKSSGVSISSGIRFRYARRLFQEVGAIGGIEHTYFFGRIYYSDNGVPYESLYQTRDNTLFGGIQLRIYYKFKFNGTLALGADATAHYEGKFVTPFASLGYNFGLKPKVGDK